MLFRFALTLALLGVPQLASAQSDIAEGQRLVNEASQSYGAGDFEAALAALKKAEVIAESAQDASLASIRFNIARCLEQLGRVEDALEAYKRYDQLPDAPHRKQKAFTAMQALEQQVFAVLSVSCAPAGAVVSIPGVTKGPRPCPWQSAKVLPGAYAVRVSAPGHAEEVRSITVKAGTAENVQVSLTPKASLGPSAAVTADSPSGPGLDPVPLVFIGGGAVVAGLGGVFTALSIDQRNAAETSVPGPAQDGAVSDFETFRALSLVSYGVGAALAATGAVLFFLPEGENDPEAARLIPSPNGFTVKF